jgi:hypothetical protein
MYAGVSRYPGSCAQTIPLDEAVDNLGATSWRNLIHEAEQRPSFARISCSRDPLLSGFPCGLTFYLSTILFCGLLTFACLHPFLGFLLRWYSSSRKHCARIRQRSPAREFLVACPDNRYRNCSGLCGIKRTGRWLL